MAPKGSQETNIKGRQKALFIRCVLRICEFNAIFLLYNKVRKNIFNNNYYLFFHDQLPILLFI